MSHTPNHKNTTSNVAIAIWLLLFILAAWFVYQSSSATQNTAPADQIVGEEKAPTRKHQVGEPLVLEWTLATMDDLTSYTHILTDDTDVVYGIKSTSKDLYEFSGEVSVKWKVVDIKNGTAILDISEIIDLDNDVENLDENAKLTYLPQLALMIDLSQTNGFELDMSTDSIQINDTNGTWSQAVLTINPFTCTPGDGLKDCEVLLEKFGDPLNDQFTSANDITYYNMTETNTRLAFNTRNVWYYFIPSTDNDIASFVDLISFIDNSTIQESAATFAQTACVTIDGNFDPEAELDIQLWTPSKWLISTVVKWVSTEWLQIDCVLQTRLWAELEHKLMSVSLEKSEIVQEEMDTEIAQEIPKKEEEIVEEIQEVVVNTEIIATWTSNVNNLRVRSEKTTWENVIGAVNIWDQVDILEIQDDRLQIVYEWDEARVSSSFITIESEQIIEEDTQEVIVEQEEEETIEQEQDEVIVEVEEQAVVEETQEEDNEWAQTNKVINSWTTFSSARGYTLFFSDKNIAYDGSVSDQIVEWCVQQINVISWAAASEVRTNPDMIIQVCTTEQEDIWTLIWTYNSDSFYLQDLTGNLNMDVTVSSALE